MKTRLVAIVAILLLNGCISASKHSADVQYKDTQNLTVGTIQKEIKIGMSGAEVAETLGTPNIVSTDEKRREVWVYDKVATDTVHSSSSGWMFAILAGGQTRSGAISSSQRTLTIIIKFDEKSLVRDFAYHASKF